MDLKTLKLSNSQLRCGWLLYIWNKAFMAHLRVSKQNRKGLKGVFVVVLFLLYKSSILDSVYTSLCKCSVLSDWHIKPFRRARF